MDPLDVIAALTIEDGRTWADAAVDMQVAAMRAWLTDARPYHFDTRSRGSAKTSDCAALVLGVLATDPTARIDWLAADQDQGRLCIESIEGHLDRNPALADQFKVTANRVTSATGGRLEILAADAPGAWGRRPTLLIVDEFAQWSETDRSVRLWRAMSTTMTKMPNARMVVITTAGNPRHFAFKILEHARSSDLWRVSETPGPAPWADAARLADQRASLPGAVFDQL